MDQDINDTRMTEYGLGQSAGEAPDNLLEGPSYAGNHTSVDASDVAFEEIDLASLEAWMDGTYPKERGHDHNLSNRDDSINRSPSSTYVGENFWMQHENRSLCERCKSFRWDAITELFTLKFDDNRAELARSHCQFCRFIARLSKAQKHPHDGASVLTGLRMDLATYSSVV